MPDDSAHSALSDHRRRRDAMTAIVLRGDARALPFPDASVDLVVTSPPYWALRDYRDGDTSLEGQIGNEATPWAYLGSLWEATAEWVRILKPEGSLFVVLGDKYANRTRGAWRGSSDGYTWRAASPRYVRTKDLPEKSLIGLPWRYAIGCIDQLGLILRSEIVWSKPSPMPESVTDRARRSHEQIFHFTRQQRYFHATDAIREPHKAPRRIAGATAFSARDRNITRTGSGTVLDPFGGSGTTALVASALRRRGVSIDRSTAYCRLARWRTRDPGERARALGLPKPPPPVPGQEAIFDHEEAAHA